MRELSFKRVKMTKVTWPVNGEEKTWTLLFRTPALVLSRVTASPQKWMPLLKCCSRIKCHLCLLSQTVWLAFSHILGGLQDSSESRLSVCVSGLRCQCTCYDILLFSWKVSVVFAILWNIVPFLFSIKLVLCLLLEKKLSNTEKQHRGKITSSIITLLLTTRNWVNVLFYISCVCVV